MNHPQIPLFPLGVVLFPGMPLPLHIFEDRYKQMIGECLEQNTVFGVVYYTGKDFYRVGCSAAITSTVHRYEDGRLDIITAGRRRFVIRNIVADKPYLVGEVEYFDDDPTEGSEELEALSRATSTLYKDILRDVSTEAMPELPEQLTYRDLSFLIPAAAGFTLAEKQAFLEMTSVAERLKKSEAALRRLMDRTRASRDIESLISGNGHLHNQTL